MICLAIHPQNPQRRLLQQVVDRLRAGAVIIYPTDSAYALGCRVGDKAALDRIRAIRRLDERHNFTLVCRDLSELSTYAVVDNASYRLLRTHTPGPYTFILRATPEVPRRLMHPKRKTIGMRVPDNRIALALLELLDEPLMSVTLILPGEDLPLTDPGEMCRLLGHAVDVVVDGGGCGLEPTTVVDLAGPVPAVLRHGKGATQAFA
jgi:tRNA threonylcarbamoyl adenosine modification protein (Sua5/YciO/YrdC/YwlC family)